MSPRPIAFFAVLVASAMAVACSAPAQQRIGIVAPPEDQFPPVADYLEHRCGTLDCHGQPGRNLRMWGCDGMRLNPMDISGCILGRMTTPDEYEATYRSLVGLEPGVMSFVVQGHATQPDLLTFVRKARGTESHKGGQLICPGDTQDVCIVSWLAGQTDKGACGKAIGCPVFPPQPGPPPTCPQQFCGTQGVPMDASTE